MRLRVILGTVPAALLPQARQAVRDQGIQTGFRRNFATLQQVACIRVGRAVPGLNSQCLPN